MSKKISSVPPLIGGGTILNEDDYNSLLSMISSKDVENHTVAQAILNKCNVQESIYWIWKLAKHSYHTSRMVNLRTKASRNFRDTSDLYTIYCQSPESFCKYLINKDWLTPWIFEQCKNSIIEKITRQIKNEFFNINVIELKDKYKHFSPNIEIINIIKDE